MGSTVKDLTINDDQLNELFERVDALRGYL